MIYTFFNAKWVLQTITIITTLTLALTGISVSAPLEPNYKNNDKTKPLVSEGLVVTSSGIQTPMRTHIGNIAVLPQQDDELVEPYHYAQTVNRAPGVFIQQGSGQEGLTSIRSPVLTGGAGAGSFLYLEDSISLRAPGFSNVNGLFEAFTEETGSIEIVRGPGSALYGSNAVHGLINILSRPPSLEPEIIVDIWGGEHNLRYLRTSASTTLLGDDDALYGWRGSMLLAKYNGWREHTGYELQKTRLRHDYEYGNTTIRATLTGFNLRQETAGYILGRDNYKTPARRTNPNPEAYRNAWAMRAGVRFENTLSDTFSLVVTPYGRVNRMEFLMHFLPGMPLEENGHWSLGVQNTLHKKISVGGRITSGLDVDYTYGFLKEIQESDTVFGRFVQGVHYDYVVKSLVLAPYTQLLWPVGDKGELRLGLRYEYTRYDYKTRKAAGTDGQFLRSPNRTDSFHDLTPKVGYLYNFSDNLAGFVSLAVGARAPQTTDLYRLQSMQTPGEVKSERLRSLDTGLRGQLNFVDLAVDFEFTTYVMLKDRFYFRDADGLNVPNGKTSHAGVELDFAVPLFSLSSDDGFFLAGAMTYARHRYEFNRPITSSPGQSETIRKGAEIDSAPRTLGNIRLQYKQRDLWKAELEWVHVGRYKTDAANTHDYSGHNLLNLRIRGEITPGFSAYGRILNITDRAYAARADYFRGNDRYFPGEPRRIALGFLARF
ncbi:MAG: TonB-dependent receptor [Parvularculales bacterium]